MSTWNGGRTHDPANLSGPSDWFAALDVLDGRYRRYLGNDHDIDVLPFNIPILNEYAFWTGPPTFTIFRVFFGKEGDAFSKSFFVLSHFDLRIARLVGVRMVVTDASTIPGGTLVYETKAGESDLRIFRIDDTNLGQYSPTFARRVRSPPSELRISIPNEMSLSSTIFRPIWCRPLPLL